MMGDEVDDADDGASLPATNRWIRSDPTGRDDLQDYSGADDEGDFEDGEASSEMEATEIVERWLEEESVRLMEADRIIISPDWEQDENYN